MMKFIIQGLAAGWDTSKEGWLQKEIRYIIQRLAGK
jgi:hypothetical protein